jgi:hypothetical protein
MYDAFWALPAHLGTILVLYLGVFREVVIELLQLLGGQHCEHQHYIFVGSSPRTMTSPTSELFSATKINQTLHRAGLELAYEVRVYRHVMQAIYDNQLSHLPSRTIKRLLDNADNQQAQHSTMTHDNHYARDEIAHGTGLQLTARNGQLAISRLFHAWYGFVPADVTWEVLSDHSVPSTISNHLLFALGIARQCMLAHYRLTDSGDIQCAERVSNIMRLKPFLLGNDVSPLPSSVAVC